MNKARGSHISTGVHADDSGTRRAPSLEVDAMKDRIVLGALDSPDCQVYDQAEKLLQSSELSELDSSLVRVHDLASGLEQLASGEVDVVAMPATEMSGNEGDIAASGCQVIGAMTPRRPNLILVSPDRIAYQPRGAIIVSESELVRRQLLRARPDLQVMPPDSLAAHGIVGSVPDDSLERSRWLGSLLGDGSIDGFVSSRAEYENSDQTERRHTLMPFPKERGGAHFLPPPYSNLVVFISRAGLPISITEKITEPEGNTVLWVQSRILNEMGGLGSDVLGLQVRHRQVGSLRRQAEEEKDLVLLQACSDPDGEIIEDEVRVEVRMETLSEDGRRTLALDRMIAYADYQHAIITLSRDWEALLSEATRPVPKDHPSDEDAPSFI